MISKTTRKSKQSILEVKMIIFRKMTREKNTRSIS